MNAILFAAKHGQSTNGCILYLTMSPCMQCAKSIIQAGIKQVYCLELYRNTEGLDLLKKSNISVIIY